MNTTQEDAVNNFILDYLPPSTNISIPKPKCIMQLKRRIIRVDALQKHCLTLNHHLSDKSKELEDTLKRLDSTQEDYKQTSLEYQETLENASKIEMENQTLNAKVATLEREHLHAVTQVAASQSHIVQLEQLLIQKDRKIESLEKYDPKNIEKIIEERIGAEIKEKDKEKLLWKKRYERLQKKIKDDESKKKKNKALILKHEKQSTENNSDCQSLDGHSDNEDNNSVELMSQMIEQQLSQNSTRTMKTSPINFKDRTELDNDNSNEIVSIDTGCGSSLASSDNEKWLNSPDYIFSPIHADNMENFRGRKLITVGTSPILSKNVNDIATSPILSVILSDVGTSPIEPIKMTDVATSPVHTEFETEICKPEYIDKDAIKPFIKSPVSSSPLTNNTTETAKSLVNILENIIETDKQESVNTNKSTVEQLDIQNSINDADMAKMRDKTNDGIIKPVTRFDNLTTPDMQISTIATEHNPIEPVNICKDTTSPGADNNVKPAISIENLTNSDMQMSMTATKQNPIGPDNICKDVTRPDADNNVKPVIRFENLTNPDMQMSMTATQQNSIEPVNIYKDITSPDADNNAKPPIRFENLTNPDMQIYTTATDQNPVEPANIFKYITNPDAANTIKTVTTFENLTNPDMQISTTATDQNPIEPVNIFKDITSPDADKDEQETESTTHEISKNLSITDIQENTNESKEIEHTSPITFEENITQIRDNNESSTLVTVEQIKKAEELLNFNSSNNVNVNNDMDTEIEMILKSMRFNRKLITPLPRTPVKTVCQPANKNSRDILVEEITHTLCQEAAIAKDLAGAAREEASSAKEYAAKLREDHIKLLGHFNKLQKDMLSIKIMLNSQISLRDNIDLQGNDTISTLSNNFSSEYLHDRSSKHHNKFSLDQTPDKFSILDDNDNLCDQQELPKVGNNNFKSSYMQSSPLRSRKKSRSGESQDRSTTLGNSDAEILQDSINDINLDILDSQPKQPLGNKIKIISDNVIKPTDLEHLKSKKDWENFIQNSQQGVEQQCNKEQHKSLSLKIDCYNSEEQEKLLDKDTKKRKRNSARKLTSLAKYRKKCEKPVFKIKRETPPLGKSCKKLMQLRVCSKKVTNYDNAATLNDKNIYANAVKIMSELNTKNSKCCAETTTDIETQGGKDKDRAINSSETSPKTRSSCGPCKESDNNFQNSVDITCSKSTSSPKCTIVTRSRKISERVNNNILEGAVNSVKVPSERSVKKENILHSPTKNNKKSNQNVNDTPLANRKRKLSDCSDTSSKRILRNTQTISADLNEIECESDKRELVITADKNPKESILCVMIQKYGIHSMHYKSRNVEEGEDSMTVCDIIEKFMSVTQHLTCKKKRDELVNDLQFYNYKNFIGGLMRYLNNPERKCELFSKMSGLPGQIQITKSEAVLMYVIQQLRKYWSSVDIIEAILSNIEYILFRLNQTPIFEIVESMAHFYAVLCRLNDDRDRLITFMLDSMYCILFKSVVLIKQCLEAWPNIIPLAHMSKAKTPLMTCFVYLLHFFKCEDRFNRLPEIRNIMYRKYFYEIKDWNETKIVDLLKCSIKELRDNEHDKKMLRIAVIVFGKRHGPKWTNNNIIKKILKPFIDNQNTAIYIKVFCIALIGPLFKPYPVEMKVHCDIALDQLISILNTTKSKQIAEAALTSIVLMGRHNFHRVNEVLLSRKMETIDPALEELIRDHVRMRTVNTWLRTLPKIGYNCNSANK